MGQYAAFWSYTSFDDLNDDAWVSELRTALIREFRALSGKHVEIFQDVDGITWGERWNRKLVSSSDDAIFLIPIITPSYFASEPCRQELEQFVDREKTTCSNELILPIYYIDAPQLEDEFAKASDFLAQIVAEHNYEDLRSLRHRSITSFEAKQKVKALATALSKRLKGYALSQLSSAGMKVFFTAPLNHARAPRCPVLSGILHNVSQSVDIWLVVETGSELHPQVRLGRDREKFQARVTIGRAGLDQGSEFSVHALAVTEDVSTAFERYCKDGSKINWAGVPKPTDSRVLATLKLIRDDSGSP